MKAEHKIFIWLNVLIAIGMSTCVFTGQLKVDFLIFDYRLVFPASNIFFALLTFPVTDIITEIYGKKQAQQTVLIGFASQIITILIIQLCLLLPGETQNLQPFAIGGVKVLLASAVAYFIAQYWDIFVFHWIKEKWTGRHYLWIRNNASTMTSQIINSTLFITIVFGPDALWVMLPGSIIVKTILAFIDTPIVYLVCSYLKRRTEDEQAIYQSA